MKIIIITLIIIIIIIIRGVAIKKQDSCSNTIEKKSDN